jgi:hypothetical protein
MYLEMIKLVQKHFYKFIISHKFIQESGNENDAGIHETISSNEGSESGSSSSELECPPPLKVRVQRVTGNSTGSQTVENEVSGKDGTSWYGYTSRISSTGRLKNLNIMRVTPGPTSFATSRIKKGSPLSAWRTVFDETMLRHITACTIAEAHRQLGNGEWQVSTCSVFKI